MSDRRSTRRRHGLLLAVLVGVAAPVHPAKAQVRSGYAFTRTPSHGRPGTVIHLRGAGCAYEGRPYEFAEVFFYFTRDEEFARPRARGTYDVRNDGSFQGNLTVPRTAPAGPYRMSVNCYAADMVFHVADETFTVDGVSSPSAAPSRPPTPSASPTPPPVPRSPSPTPSRAPPASPSPHPSPSRRSAAPAAPVVTRAPDLPSAALPGATGGHGLPVTLAMLLAGANLVGHLRIRRADQR